MHLRTRSFGGVFTAMAALGQPEALSAGGPSAPVPNPGEALTRPQDRAAPAALIGVLSDTHGYLDPLILDLFARVDHIIHAGDIVDPRHLSQLAALAPVTAVAGNADTGELDRALPRESSGEVGGIRFVVGHKRKRLLKRLVAGKLNIDQNGAVPNLVVFGHEHMPYAAWVDGTLLLNPGTASSPEEEDDDPTVAIVQVKPSGLSACFIPLVRRRGSDEGV